MEAILQNLRQESFHLEVSLAIYLIQSCAILQIPIGVLSVAHNYKSISWLNKLSAKVYIPKDLCIKGLVFRDHLLLRRC